MKTALIFLMIGILLAALAFLVIERGWFGFIIACASGGFIGNGIARIFFK